MAKVLKEFPRETREQSPFDRFTDGKVYLLTHGEDYHTAVEYLRQSLSRCARRHGMKVRTSRRGVPDTQVIIQFYKPKANGKA